MKTNWPVVYRGGRDWYEPGPFLTYVGWRLGMARLVAAAAGDDPAVAGLFESVAAAVDFVPAPFPDEWLIDRPSSLHHPGLGMGPGDHLDLEHLSAVGKAILAGPKLFRPAATECEPLEQVDLTLCGGDYRQPYPVCVVEFPPDYSGRRIVPSTVSSNDVRPGLCVVCQENGVVMACLLYSLASGRREWEGHVVGISSGNFEAVFDHYGESCRTHIPFIRAALNFLMLATGRCRAVGPAEPQVAEAIRGFLNRAKRRHRRERAEELRNRLRLLPTVYALSQNIRLFDQEPSQPAPNPEAEGAPKRPHWRKGHWRRVAVGAGRAGRELRFIRPVLVNGDLLPGRP